MIITDPKLRALESLVNEAAKALQTLSAQKAKLVEANARLEADNRKLKEDLRVATSALSRQERIRLRLARLSQRLEKLA